jgi:hypothetical protein
MRAQWLLDKDACVTAGGGPAGRIVTRGGRHVRGGGHMTKEIRFGVVCESVYDRGEGALVADSGCVVCIRTGMVARPRSAAVACISSDRSR